MIKKCFFFTFFLVFLSFCSFAAGADAAYPVIERVCEQLPIPEHTMYTLNDQELELLLEQCADTGINLFELMDCLYRYLAPQHKRMEILGDAFRKAQNSFNYGGHPIELLLPIEKLIKVQIGASFNKEQKALDMYLDSPYSVYIDIATAAYDSQCGFAKIEPLTFLESYGMQIKKWTIVKAVRKIHLYEPGLGAVYAKGFFRPKRWHLGAVSKIVHE